MKKKQLDIEDTLNTETGELIPANLLNKVIVKEERRKDGSLRISYDYQYCPTMAEQHTAHLSDINYLMEKYQPDELDAYLAARAQYRREIVNHDFSIEPDLQSAKNTVYQSIQAFNLLPDDIKRHFKNHVEFLKFIDNPDNQDKMIKMGLLKPKQIEDLIIKDEPVNVATQTQRTQDAKDNKPQKPASES